MYDACYARLVGLCEGGFCEVADGDGMWVELMRGVSRKGERERKHF